MAGDGGAEGESSQSATTILEDFSRVFHCAVEAMWTNFDIWEMACSDGKSSDRGCVQQCWSHSEQVGDRNLPWQKRRFVLDSVELLNKLEHAWRAGLVTRMPTYDSELMLLFLFALLTYIPLVIPSLFAHLVEPSIVSNKDA